MKGRSLQEWVRDEIQQDQAKIDSLSREIATLEPQLAEATEIDEIVRLEGCLSTAHTKLRHEQEALARSQWIQPYLERHVPSQPFPTLVAVGVLLFIGTLLKIVFMVSHTILVERLSNLATLDLRKSLFRRTLKMHPAAFDADGAGELMARFTYDMESIYNGLNSLFGKCVREPLKMLACFAGAAYICCACCCSR